MTALCAAVPRRQHTTMARLKGAALQARLVLDSFARLGLAFSLYTLESWSLSPLPHDSQAQGAAWRARQVLDSFAWLGLVFSLYTLKS